MRRLALACTALLALGACNETGLSRGELPDPADPPERELDLWGTPPSDWQNCYGGLRGIYYNLTPGHPDVETYLDDPMDPEGSVPALDELDWWDGAASFQRYDATTDFGPNWWPVDGGFQGDPQYFAARWVGWLRVTQRNRDHDFVVGAASDMWVKLDDDVLIQMNDNDEFESEVQTHRLETGVYRLDVRYAHRLGETNGFRFRVASDEIIICYPEFGDEPETEE
mgnify:FL=1